MVKGSSSGNNFFSNGFYEFSKVYLPHQSSQQLGIPQSFLKHFGGDFPQTCQLEVYEMNKIWTVDLIKVDEDFSIDKGWEQFVEDTHLGYGDFLIFRYDGSSNFNVRVFGFNGFEKDFAAPDEHQSDKRRKICKSGTSCSKPVRVDNKPKRRESKHIVKKSSNRSSGTLQNGNFLAAEKKEFKSKYPRFILNVRKSYITTGRPNLSINFANKYMKRGQLSKIYEVKLCVSNKSWTVRLKVYKFHFRTYKFSGGWAKFASHNNLKEGNVCIFELIDELVFEVTILRDPNSLALYIP